MTRRRRPLSKTLARTAALAPVLAATLALALPSNAGAQEADRAGTYGRSADPFERLNRGLFLVGGALDVVLIRPAAVFYAHAAPKAARRGVSNVLANLDEPVNFANHVLQLHPAPAVRTLGRFVVNSTIGVGGLLDVAEHNGLKPEGTNFGQTLARYGVSRGPYLYLPALGPSSVRDGAGKIVDAVMDPFTWIRFRDDAYFIGGRIALNGLSARVAADPVLKDVQRTSTDIYATLRASYLQHSDFLSNGGRQDVQSLPDFGPETPPPQKP